MSIRTIQAGGVAQRRIRGSGRVQFFFIARYRAVSAAGTPPLQDRIESQEGFWVRVLENGKNPTSTEHYLPMPLVE